MVATIFSGSGAPKRNRNIFVGPVGFGWRIRFRFRAMERAGEEAPLPGDFPTLFTRRRTVTFNEGTGQASSGTLSSASMAFDPWAAARAEDSSEPEGDLLREHQRAAMVAPVNHTYQVGWTGWENWEEESSENADGWRASSRASLDRSSVASWSASSWSSEHRDWGKALGR